MHNHCSEKSVAAALMAAVLFVWSAVLVRAQSPDPSKSNTPAPASIAPPVGGAALTTAQKGGIPLATSSDVSGTVGVEAVLLPYSLAKRTFGREVAEKYAVVSLTVSNRDQRQGLILHSVFLDYSHWLFSGIFSGMGESAKASTEVWQQQDKAAQVSSAEVRTVRTDFQDAQLWSTRNMVLHIATAVGATAASLSFSTANDLFAPSVAAFNGNVIPALGAIWPDNSQVQLNLLNDIGFRTNRVIPAKSSDVIIAFFPMERFLTPTMQKIYKTAPAVFLNPSEILLEKDSKDKNIRMLRKTLEDSKIVKKTDDCDFQCTVMKAVVNYEAKYELAKRNTPLGNTVPNPCASPNGADEAAACLTVGLLNRMSLNNIRLVVGGIMTVDVSSVPATISSVTIANSSKAGTWGAGQTVTGLLTGSFLSSGNIAITGSTVSQSLDTSSFGTITVDAATASDASLPFSFKIGTAAIAPGSKLTFTVTKIAQDKSTTVSSPLVYTVNTDPVLTVNTSSWAADQKVTGTITGTGLSGVTLQSVHGQDATDVTLAAGNFTITSPAGNDTSLGFSVTPVKTVPANSNLQFQLSAKHPDGSPVVLTYTVPAAQ